MMKNRNWRYWLMPVMITILSISASICVFADIHSPVRILFVLSFLIVCPGMAFIEHLNIDDRLTSWTLAVALSLALDTMVSLIVLYTVRWSVELIMGIIIVLTLSGVALQVWKSRNLPGFPDSHAV